MPKTIIQIIGVGGGGTNAVNHMYAQNIKAVQYFVCNTDAYSLEHSPVQYRVQLGPKLTEGLGAGSKPSKGEAAAQESIKDIEAIFHRHTKMVFITAGMGGGTGTGAAPVIVKKAAELGLLTVAVVTIPFAFEGKKREAFAREGIQKIKQYADATIIIKNDNITKLYGDMTITNAFAQADNVLMNAVKGISDIITLPGYVGVDFEDVKTVMLKSGTAFMGNGSAKGENRAIEAIKQALHSPLLDNSKLIGAQKILLNISSHPATEITMNEFDSIQQYVRDLTHPDADLMFGIVYDERLTDDVHITVIVTGLKD